MKNISTSELENSRGRRIFADFLLNNFENKDLLQIFDKLTELYIQVNSVINISALRNYDDIYIKHYLDSVYPYKYFDGECADIGCGGGFPCIPLSIVTDLNFTGIESVGKKLTLIKRCVSELNFKNINTEYSRSEDLAKNNVKFDTVCARAVADPDKSIKLCAPLTRSGGKIILYRTQNDERASISTETLCNVKLHNIVDYVLPETEIKRRLFIYAKE